MTTMADIPGRWTHMRNPAPRVWNDGQGWSATMALETDEQNVLPFLTALAGTRQPIIWSGGTFSRIVPLQHPVYTSLWLQAIDGEMFGTPTPTPNPPLSMMLNQQFSRARFNLTFRAWPFPTIGDQPYMSIEQGQSVSYVTMPGTSLVFPSDETVIGADAGIFIVENTYVITLYQCPDMNDTASDMLAGTANANPVFGKAPGHLRFNGVQASYQVNVGGMYSYTRRYELAFRSVPWNEFLRPDGVWEEPLKPDGTPVYELMDWSSLFQ